eukprot:3793297-Pleurochrysis_carterae.AAC.1
MMNVVFLLSQRGLGWGSSPVVIAAVFCVVTALRPPSELMGEYRVVHVRVLVQLAFPSFDAMQILLRGRHDESRLVGIHVLFLDDRPPPDVLDCVFSLVFRLFFHAVTGTHVDAVYGLRTLRVLPDLYLPHT